MSKDIISSKARKTLRYVTVISVPILFGLLAVLFWKYFLYDNGLFFSKDAETPILYIIMPPVGFIYVIFASIAVNSAFDKHKNIRRSITRKDVDTYVERADQKIPGIMHVLIAMPSVALLFVAMTHQYVDFYAGVATVFLVSFVISTTWVVVNELDNGHKRSYVRHKVPEHWRDKKAEEHFSED